MTLREALNRLDFDWQTGEIVLQAVMPDCYAPGWASGNDLRVPKRIQQDDPALDVPFDTGHGAPEMPRFLAKDATRIYFPGTYDGATWVEAVYHNLDTYCVPGHALPYCGGG